MACAQNANTAACSCTYPCSRHGHCCECVAYHRRSNEIPGCFFSPAGERSYDRSLQAFCRDREQNQARG
ncbi:MAG TPA: DUF6485 family protein [Holophaga sp.]|nr:DUF6485 family protein [Holophaga sp.]